MTELGLRAVTHGFGGPPLLDGVDLALERGDRVGLIGRNGAGKSTLLALAAGRLEPDAGERVLRPGVRVAELPQVVPAFPGDSVRGLLERALSQEGGDGEVSDWELEARVHAALSALGLGGEERFDDLSAGLRRRVLLARARIGAPDVLVLDEPTNHVDLAGVLELEEELARFEGALLLVTHDRAFLRRVANRIVVLDRGALHRYDCDYDTAVARREAELLAEEERARQFQKRLAKEEAWLRQGIKARRTRNQGRVRALERMRREWAQRRERVGVARARRNEAERTGELVLRAEGLGKSFGDVRVLEGVDLEVWRGERIGIVGPNGSGKSTLLSLLLGELEPDSGHVKRGTRVEVGRFDQLQGVLDEELTVRENVAGSADFVRVGGHERHVLGYLADFLFPPEVAQGPITRLSGGERNRLQLARLMARPANLLVLDEPTNDLDLETLEVLEDLLAEFTGTVLVVSHDREFLEHVVTRTLVVPGDGGVREVLPGAFDWRTILAPPAPEEPRPTAPSRRPRPEREGTRRRSYHETRELEALPERIEALEAAKTELESRMADPAFYRREKQEIAADTTRIEELTDELERAYARWEELDALGD